MARQKKAFVVQQIRRDLTAFAVKMQKELADVPVEQRDGFIEGFLPQLGITGPVKPPGFFQGTGLKQDMIERLTLARKQQAALRQMSRSLITALEYEKEVLDQLLRKLGVEEEEEV